MDKIDIEKISEGNHKAYSELIETLEKVKDAIKKQNYGIAMDILCKPYPAFQVITLSSGLKESEDEKSKKWILEYLHDGLRKSDEQFKDHFKAAISWFEKQGEKDEEILILKDQIESLHAAIKAIKETHRIELEKRGEQNLANSAKTCEDEQKSIKTCAEYYNKDRELKMPVLSEFQDKLADILMHREYDGPDETEDDIAKGRLEYELAAIRLSEELLPLAQKEQKPADKVEQKYHEGDWVVTDKNNVVQIKAIENGKYVLGNTMKFSVDYVDKCWRKWTIQDAKDGDMIYVSTEEKGIQAIFKSCDDNYIYFHCFLCQDFHADGYLPIIDIEFMCPLQKIHYNRFFEKIKETGYVWDAEKKELKKIDDEEFNGEDYGIDSLYHAQRILEKTLGKVEGYQTDDGILSHQCAISAVKKLYGQKPWSEEDENMIKRIKEYLNIAIGDLSNKLNGRIVTIGNSEYSSMMFEISKCISWLEVRLKSIKDIYTWKPSVEQMDALSFYLKNDVDNDGVFGLQLVKLYQDLKKLREE